MGRQGPNGPPAIHRRDAGPRAPMPAGNDYRPFLAARSATSESNPRAEICSLNDER
jgi:hypothetical protein